jgi:hypothetical protein
MTATLATLRTQALAYITAWLTEDYWTMAKITADLKRTGATPEQVAEQFSLAAAALLTDVFKGLSSQAAAWANSTALREAARQAQASGS